MTILILSILLNTRAWISPGHEPSLMFVALIISNIKQVIHLTIFSLWVCFVFTRTLFLRFSTTNVYAVGSCFGFLLSLNPKYSISTSKSAMDNVHRNWVKDKVAFDSLNLVELFRSINGPQALGVEDFLVEGDLLRKVTHCKKDTNHCQDYQQVETSCHCKKYILSHVLY